ncbi:TPA: SirB2 family protein [Photobacterium damselae]|uniref:SirB2 family protein n=1 Tax=Photobacterium damselae TaxID=38293 RepID=UPI00084A7517|nr:SirB2 family protein [Photobacterium damselae]EHA1082056.1 SirB2 family protein [Photobacterium damselae]ELI6449288.1 SirB2 family protein [Photobacterium damselae]ELV7518037.1 SirB2 family protein [Photobacterium damselae]MBA5684790.1 SirB2 family protein [Photobacterium damselae subsp. damselae]MCG9706306.1 SirB2 family protein [Photobacterium damselae]
MYEAMKHLHLLAIALSALLLTLRYILLMANSSLLQKKALKVTPHVVDTILVATGVALIFITGFYPFTPGSEWLTQKLSCVLAYIALGYFTLHVGKNKVFKTFAFLGALGWLVLAAKLAVTKVPLFG